MPPRAPGRRRAWTAAFFVAVLIAAAYSIFVLPYDFPPKDVVDSVSYAMGFNNKVAAAACLAAIGLLSLGVLRAGVKVERAEEVFHPAVEQDRSLRVGATAFWILCLVYAGVIILLYIAIPALDNYGESRYFMRRIELVLQYGLRPYRQIEFAYGPALIYLPVWAASIGQMFRMSHDLSYLIVYLALSILGVWLLYYVVNGLRSAPCCGAIAFVLLGFFMLNVCFGLQYTPMRYLIQFAALLWLNRAICGRSRLVGSPLTIAAAGFVLAGAVMSVSPEMGVAYLGAQTVYFLVAAFLLKRSMAWGALGGLLVLPVFLVAFSAEYLACLGSFSKGGNNFPVVPAAHIVLYLATVFYAVPLLVAAILDRRGRRDAKPIMVGWAALVMMMIPSAMGRCDPGHVLTGSIGAILLAFALLARYRPRAFTVYAVLFLLVGVAGMYISEVYLYRDQLEPVKEALCTGVLPAKGVRGPPALLASLQEYRPLAIPLGADPDTEYYLRKTDRLIPDYYPDSINVFDQATVDRKLARLATVDTVLVPQWVLVFREIDPQTVEPSPEAKNAVEAAERHSVSMLFLYPVPYQMKYRRYDAYAAVGRYLATHFEPVRGDGGYLLMVRAQQ